MIAGIILAAGESRRMGRSKQLLEVGGRTLLQRVVDAALASSLDDVCVVLGHHAQEVLASLLCPVRSIVNEGYAEGMGSSVRAGMAALPEGTSAVMFLLADQPGVTADVIDTLVAHSTPNNIVAPSVQGHRSNPTVFGRRWFPDLAQCTGDAGGRTIIATHSEALTLVELEADLRDVDTPEDLAGLI